MINSRKVHPRSRFVTIRGINYHYLEYPASGPGLFLLHGLGSSTYSWEALAPLLQAEGFRVYVLDLKGSGWSDKPAASEYDLFTLRDEIDRWLETMGLRTVVFVGNSLGGSLALLLALENPNRISRLVLIDAAAYLEKLPWVFRLARLPFSMELSRILFKRWLIKLAMKQAFFQPERVTSERIDAYWERLKSPGCLEAQIALVRSLDFGILSRYDRRLPAIDIPTLLIWGEEDPWIKLPIGRRLNRDLPRSSLRIIPRCGHAPQEELPEETAGLIVDWLSSAPTPH
jgi:pimeloyl-ACP methyl ester carboxylesterase